MIQAECSCGWTMAGPPAGSWEIDQAVDEHDIWCPDARDWVNDELEGQRFERDRIIGRIRATFPQHHADFIVDVITRNTKSDHGTPAKKFPVIALSPNPQEEVQDMYNTTSDPTASAWHPLWCTSKHKDDWCGDDGKLLRFHRHLIGRPSQATVTLVQEDHPEDTGPVMVGVYDLDRDLNLAELDELIGVLATARQRLIEVV